MINDIVVITSNTHQSLTNYFIIAFPAHCEASHSNHTSCARRKHLYFCVCSVVDLLVLIYCSSLIKLFSFTVELRPAEWTNQQKNGKRLYRRFSLAGTRIMTREWSERKNRRWMSKKQKEEEDKKKKLFFHFSFPSIEDLRFLIILLFPSSLISQFWISKWASSKPREQQQQA